MLSTSPARSSAKVWGPGVLIFFLGWLFLFANRTTLFPLLSVIADDFSLSGVQIGTISSVFFVFYGSTQVLGGFLSDRVGFRRTLATSYAVAGVALVGLGLLATRYETLLLFVAIHGLATGVYFPSAFGYVLRTSPPHLRAVRSATVFVGIFVGMGAGFLFSGPVFRLLESWRLPFVLLAIPTTLMAGVYLRAIQELPPKPAGPRAPLRSVLGQPRLIALFLANFCSLYGFWLILIWGPLFLQTEHGFGVTGSGLFAAIFVLSAIPVSILVGRVSDRIGRRPLSLVLFPLAAASLFFIAHSQSLLGLALALLFFGATGKPAVEPILLAWVGDDVARSRPEAMGTAMGVVNLIGISSGIVAPVLSGLIRDLTGSLVGAFYLGAALLLFGFLMCLFSRESEGG